MLSRFRVTVSVAAAIEVNPVPPAMVAVFPSEIVCVPESPANIQEDIVPPPAGVAQVLSPLKKVEPEAVPVADRSPVIVPVEVMVPPVMFTKVPEDVATDVTVPAVAAAHAVEPLVCAVRT